MIDIKTDKGRTVNSIHIITITTKTLKQSEENAYLFMTG